MASLIQFDILSYLAKHNLRNEDCQNYKATNQANIKLICRYLPLRELAVKGYSIGKWITQRISSLI